jgi:hypothetical protein
VTHDGLVTKSGLIPTTQPGESRVQISDVVFSPAADVPVTIGYSYAVSVNGHVYTATVDGTTVTATALSVLNRLKSLIDAGEPITASVDAVGFKLTLTADVVNTPFTIDSVTVTQSSTSTVPGGHDHAECRHRRQADQHALLRSRSGCEL